jgi:hypothetical protein
MSEPHRKKDLLGRRALAEALAVKLHQHAVGPKDLDPGPTVVTIEGPWGSGKSTLLDLVRERLPRPATSTASPPPLTVRRASRLLRDGPPHPAFSNAGGPTGAGTRGIVTAWFNPWAHQSGEQVWAGLVAEIIEAAQPVLYPTEAAREHYWFVRNLSRVDRFALRRTLHRRTLSPELTFGALGVVASLAIAVAELETNVHVAGTPVPAALIGLALSVTFLLLGGVHTGWRYLRGAAARFLPGELFFGPVTSTVAADLDGGGVGPHAEGMVDPLRRARAGSLYLHQHDVSELVADLDQSGYELVVFVDDLDRCRALTTAEVFEAINLFLAGFVSERRGTGRENPGDPGSSLRARFVIGLDPVVVAGHLDRVYADLYDPDAALDGDDPDPGWAFLRKLVHLPVLVPQVSDAEMVRVVDQALGLAVHPTGDGSGAGDPAGDEPAAAEPGAATAPAEAGPSRDAREALDDPTVRALLRQRLAAQPEPSIRDALRHLNVWDFYERVLCRTRPLDDPDAIVLRSRRLVILAEIVTRWPALQRCLHRPAGDGGTGLQALAAAVGDDLAWSAVAEEVFAGRGTEVEGLSGLRLLLRDHDGPAVADLAAQVL